MKVRISKTSAGLVAVGSVAALTLATPLLAYASTGSTAPTPATATATISPGDTTPGAGGTQGGPRGGGETALTGTTASKVTAAALAAVPGATVRRVTTEHAGASNPYEAHLTKTDGTRVTVLVGSAFNVISIEAEPGPR